MYLTYLVDTGLQSSTLRSYASAIKGILAMDDYQLDSSILLLGALTKSCRLVNDKVMTRLPIQFKLMELILFEIQRRFSSNTENQPYLQSLYMTIIILGYYGLLRIGELTSGQHPIKAKDIHVGENKDKILLYLHSSKTHGKESRPQKIKITGKESQNIRELKFQRFFCPFELSRNFMAIRGQYNSDDEPLFVFKDKTPVKPSNVRAVLKKSLHDLNLNQDLYDCHSLRIGRVSDLLKLNYSIEEIKFFGRWKSNAVYRYLRA